MSYAHEKSSSQFALDSNGDLGADLYYNSRPESRRHHQTSTVGTYLKQEFFLKYINIL